MGAARRCWWFYREKATGDYLAIDPNTRRHSRQRRGIIRYLARATAVARRVEYVRQTKKSTNYLRDYCEFAEEKDVPDDWWAAITGIPVEQREK